MLLLIRLLLLLIRLQNINAYTVDLFGQYRFPLGYYRFPGYFLRLLT